MKKVVGMKKIINIVNKIYEDISNIKILQDELEELLSAIDKINLDYKRGKISKEIFVKDEKKFKRECVKLIKTINSFISSDLKNLSQIENELAPKKLTTDVEVISQSSPKLEKNVNVGSDGNQ